MSADHDEASIEGAVVHVADPVRATFERVQGLADGMGVEVVHQPSHRALFDGLDDGQPGCIILELQFPEFGGLATLEQCNVGRIILPVLFLTDCGSIPLAVRALQQGAVGFLEKSCRDHDLWEAIVRAIRTHHTRLRWRVKQDGLASLTGSERLVLKRLLQAKSNEVTARELRISVRTVELRRANLLKKLGFTNVVELYRELYWLCPDDLEDPLRDLSCRRENSQMR